MLEKVWGFVHIMRGFAPFENDRAKTYLKFGRFLCFFSVLAVLIDKEGEI